MLRDDKQENWSRHLLRHLPRKKLKHIRRKTKIQVKETVGQEEEAKAKLMEEIKIMDKEMGMLTAKERIRI